MASGGGEKGDGSSHSDHYMLAEVNSSPRDFDLVNFYYLLEPSDINVGSRIAEMSKLDLY